MAILDVTLGTDAPISLVDLSRLTQIPKPTVRRLAINLTGRGLLVKNQDGYSPGPRLTVLGARAVERQSIRGISEPYMQELFERSRGVVWLVELNQLKQFTPVSSVYDRASMPYTNDWPRDFDDPSIIATALGRVVLADHPDQVEAHLNRGVPKLTRHTVNQPAQVRAAFARATGEGLAVEHEQVRLGWSCLAIPIAGPGSGNAVLGVVDRTARFDFNKLRYAALTTAAGIGKEWRKREDSAPGT